MHAKDSERHELYEEGKGEERTALGMLVDLEVELGATGRASAPYAPNPELGAAGRASAPSASAPVLAHGTALEGAELTVQLEGGPRPARRAKSCLVAVTPGDRVLCSVSAEAVYVLAVLESAEAGPIRVVADGGLDLQSD